MALRKHHGVMFLVTKCEAAVPQARQTFEKRLRPSTSSSVYGVQAKFNMGVFPSGQRGQTVNLLATLSVVRIHLHPFVKRLAVAGLFALLMSFIFAELYVTIWMA